MSRVKIKFPDNNPVFNTTVIVRIGDINYGNHLGNDSVLSIVHEARVRMLNSWGYTELNADGCGIIMSDVMIAYKNEAFYGDDLSIDIYIDDVTTMSFDMLYRIYTVRDGKELEVAHAKTGIVCFDYNKRKVSLISDELKNRFLLF